VVLGFEWLLGRHPTPFRCGMPIDRYKSSSLLGETLSLNFVSTDNDKQVHWKEDAEFREIRIAHLKEGKFTMD